jgi:hypothetical protein
MKKKFKKALAVILTATMAMSVGMPAFAAESTPVEAQKQANAAMAEFMLDTEAFVSALNQVSSQEVARTTWGIQERQEVRELTLDNGITIINTRTLTVNADNSRSIEDEFGFQYAGIPGALGSIVAEYEFIYETIDNPNQMKTMVIYANGDERDLDDFYYNFIDADGHWDNKSSYTETASVDFYLEFRPAITVGWRDVEYTHTCTFDKYGSYTMQWFE